MNPRIWLSLAAALAVAPCHAADDPPAAAGRLPTTMKVIRAARLHGTPIDLPQVFDAVAEDLAARSWWHGEPYESMGVVAISVPYDTEFDLDAVTAKSSRVAVHLEGPAVAWDSEETIHGHFRLTPDGKIERAPKPVAGTYGYQDYGIYLDSLESEPAKKIPALLKRLRRRLRWAGARPIGDFRIGVLGRVLEGDLSREVWFLRVPVVNRFGKRKICRVAIKVIV